MKLLIYDSNDVIVGTMEHPMSKCIKNCKKKYPPGKYTKIMKSYTDLKQSKKLAKILPIESADMCYYEYTSHIDGTPKVGYKKGITEGIPCWSLAALLDVYPMVVGRDMDMYCCWQNHKNLHSRHYNNPIDACVEMILKLNELNLL